MLITFTSRAAADVLMLGKIGQQMLELIGKDAQDPRGIVTVEQLPAAIAALSAAATADRAKAPASNEEEDEDAPKGMAAPVALAQRIPPLLELFQYALRDKEAVTWEAS
ncbi:DUF1840 domain-containing protein [Uliginosibacterium sp. H3]|uniref:DUF1840 domain-containing protein n=1 Tax=Uliginosibacterium silvisoli TaxID=3114758 RepID=A0ABU6JZA7_9RHOO|nr:DUF1840 domain-containing protein [Uliginosibacterium sp. H3]